MKPFCTSSIATRSASFMCEPSASAVPMMRGSSAIAIQILIHSSRVRFPAWMGAFDRSRGRLEREGLRRRVHTANGASRGGADLLRSVARSAHHDALRGWPAVLVTVIHRDMRLLLD